VDETVARLGEQLKLPSQYESMRSEIESVLPRIHLPVGDEDERVGSATGGPEDVSGDALGFVHRYHPPRAGSELSGRTTLLLLHGTGGDEDNLISLGRRLLPGAALLSPRGQVDEGGALRFFRRIREGVFDQEDLQRRTEDLARFIEAATGTYSLDPSGIIAVGFSNGANIAASLLLRRPGLLKGAVLLSPMVPFEPQTLPALSGTAVFIGAGRNDAMVPIDQTKRLASILERSGASVTTHWDAGGHSITPDEINAARQWLAERMTELKDVG
jgi:phospholipase/carboxylesterase/glyoxalase family protein